MGPSYRMPLSSLPQVIAMFPFFWMAPSWRIRALSAAACCYETMGWVAHMLSLLPHWLMLLVIRRFSSGSSLFIVCATDRLTSNPPLRCKLHSADAWLAPT